VEGKIDFKAVAMVVLPDEVGPERAMRNGLWTDMKLELECSAWCVKRV